MARGDHRTWIIQLLPYIDELTVYRHIDQSVGVYHANNAGVRAVELQVLECPSEPGTPGTPPASNYAAVHHDVEAPIDVNNKGVFFLNSAIRLIDVKDGTAHTLFVGEKTIESNDLGWMSGTCATLRNTGASLNETVRALPLWSPPTPDDESEKTSTATAAAAETAEAASNNDQRTDANTASPKAGAPPSNSTLFVGGFSSNHPAGANFLFGDGSVRFIPETINQAILQQLANRADGKLPPVSY